MNTWLWPDRIIYKREARRLREEHNALVNVATELLAVCEAVSNRVSDAGEDSSGWPMVKMRRALLEQLRDAIAKAKGEV